MKVLNPRIATKLFRALNSKERIILVGAVVLLIASSLTYGVMFYRTKTYPVPAHGGTYREGVVGQPAFINPVIPTTETDRVMSRLVFSSMAEMAESIRRSDDGTTWNVRLQEGITWHDGVELTADDVIFTIDVIHNPDSRSPLRGSFEGVTASRVSKLEVEFTLQNPYAFFEEDHLSSLRPIPKHLFADLPVTNYKLSPYGLSPVGSGPYQIVSHEKDSRGFIEEYSLKAFEDYFTGEPYITRLVFKFFRRDPELISSYNLGQIDGFGLSTSEPLADRSIIIRHEPHYLNSSRYYAVFINRSLAPEDLSAVGVRRALSAATGRKDIIDKVFGGNATAFYGPTDLTENLEPEMSNDLLEGLELNLVVPDEPFLTKTAEQLKIDWEVAGANVNLTVRSLRDIQEDILRNTSYEMLLFGNIVKESNDLFAFWHSSKRFFPDQNLALYQNEEVDALLEEYRRTFDQAARNEILQAISDQIASEYPAIFLYSPNYVYITTPSLGGFDETKTINTSDDRFSDIANWYVRSHRSLWPPEIE